MPTIPLRIRARSNPSPNSGIENPLPQLLHTPSGVALVELQGTIHFPQPSATTTSPSESSTQVGKLVFPLYNPSLNGPDDTKWMKRVYLYVGKNQRMSGEVKKLGKPFAVIRKVDKGSRGVEDSEQQGDIDIGGVDEPEEELEIVEVVRYKIVFSTRPEPISGEGGEEVE